MNRQAGHSRVLVGTTSWTERTLLKSPFYPPPVKTAEERLQYYSSVFPITEVDSSFYAIPPERNAVLWSERTRPGFVFDVKSYRLFTQHRTPVSSLPPDLRSAAAPKDANVYYGKVDVEIREELWRRFRRALAPLAQAQRLGVVLFQFAPWVVFGKAELEHIAHCAARMHGFRMAVELRNISWLGDKHREQTLGFLRQHRLIHVIVDEPQGTSFSVPPVWEVTSPDVAVVRLHGRNRKTWQRRGLVSAAQRFAYRYSEDELEGFIAPIGEVAKHTSEVHVLFNNCHSDWAQQNARQFSVLLAHRPEPGRAVEFA